jgi:hypothetical protein
MIQSAVTKRPARGSATKFGLMPVVYTNWVMSAQTDLGAYACLISLNNSPRNQNDQIHQNTLPQRLGLVMEALSKSIRTPALTSHSMMQANGPPTHTGDGYGFIEQRVAGEGLKGRTPCNQFVKPPTLPPRAKQARACPLSWMSPKMT